MSTIQAAIYARVSSERSATAHTIASQLAALRERVAADGCALPEAMQFLDDGYSGATLVRPALECLRDLVAAGAMDRLYIHSPDRLARKYAYQVLLVDEFHRAGIEVIFLHRELGRSPEDDLLLQVQGMMAEYERAKIVERHRRGKLPAARAGLVNVLAGAPYGYRYIDKHTGGGQARYEVLPDEARVVRPVFDWVGRDRVTIGEVCRRLTRAGERTRTGRTVWERSVVGGLLHNPAYQGTAAFGKTRQGPLRPRLRAQRGRPQQPRRATADYDVPVGRRVASHPRPGPDRRRAVCRRPGTGAGEPPSCAAVPPWGALSAPRLGALPTVWVCLVRQTDQSQSGQGQNPCLRVLPMFGDRCLSFWWRTRVYQLSSPDRSLRHDRVARSPRVTGPPGTGRGGISAAVTHHDCWHPPGTSHP